MSMIKRSDICDHHSKGTETDPGELPSTMKNKYSMRNLCKAGIILIDSISILFISSFENRSLRDINAQRDKLNNNMKRKRISLAGE